MRLETPKLFVIRDAIHVYLLDIRYPPSIRNTFDIRSASRLKLRTDVSPRSLNKIYSCETYQLLFPFRCNT